MGRSLIRSDDGTLVQRVTGTARWQSCDDEVCHLPRTERFSVDIPAARHDHPHKERADQNGMDISGHLVTMVGRRTDRPLAQVLRDMAGDDGDEPAARPR
jgi:hypothetical protein